MGAPMHSLRSLAALVLVGLFAAPALAQEPEGSGAGEAAAEAPAPAPSTGEAAEAAPEAAPELRTLPCDDTPGLQAACGPYNDAVDVYRSEIEDYRSTMNEVVTLEYRRRRTMIRDFYNREIDVRRVEERQRRLEAIDDFRAFLDRFPTHPDYTPDVLFRLAELEYEKAEDDYIAADQEYELAYERWELGIDPDEPDPARKDFSPSIQLFRRLIAEFPGYRQIDGALYLIGICYDEMGEYGEALTSFQRLVGSHPESAFAQEAYLRIGEQHFEVSEFELAAAAYERALSYGDSPWFDKILFKLGWSTYLLSRYDEGIRYFASLLDYYDEINADPNSGVREEALQYFAISVAEEDWDLDGERDAEFVMPRVERYLSEEKDYEADVIDRLADILLENQRFEYAVDVLEYAMGLDDCAPENLDRTMQVMTAYEQLRRFEDALTVQRTLGATFGPGSEWYRCQEREGNADAMAQAEQVAKDSLIDSAARYYLRAQETASRASLTASSQERTELEGLAVEQFAYAAQIYADFLEQYPNAVEAYEMQMYYAQTLLYSQQYLAAAEQFGAVRDSLDGDEFRELAAALAIQCYEYELEREIDSYAMEGRAWPAYAGDNVWTPPEPDASTSDEPRGAPEREPIPELSLAWMGAVDSYLELGLNAEDDPSTRGRYAFQAGKLQYDYKHYDDARERFVAILDECNEQPETGFAAGFLLETYRVTGDTEGFLEVTELMTTRYASCIPDDLASAIASDVNRIGMGLMAQRAEELFAEGDFEGAAQEYVRLANEYADNDDTAPLGLFNGGLIYEQQLKEFELAMRQFDRIVTEYPGSDYVDDALVRIAVNSKRFFDFDRAISTYMVLHDMGWEDPEGLFAPPLVDAAELMRASGRFDEAAAAYLEFVDDNPDDFRSAALMYQAGVMYDEMNDDRNMRRTFERFRREYGNSYSDVIDIDAAVIDTFKRSATAYDEAGESRNARTERDNLLDEFAVRLPQDVASRYAAAEVIYDQVQDEYDEWDSIELGETVEQQQSALTERRDGIEPILISYNTVIDDYGSADWTVCALYMQGRVFQRMADLLYSLPVPDFGGNIDAEDEYIILIEDFATQYEDQAIAQWEIGYPIMQQLGVRNQCTIDMTAQLNRYRGSDYPVFREASDHAQDALFTPQRFAAPPEAEEEEVLQLDSADIDLFGGEEEEGE